MVFTPIKQNTVLDQLMHQFKDIFITGDLTAGDRVPPETELASELGIGRNSIREAMTILQFLGVMEKRGPKGTYVSTSKNVTEESLNWASMLQKKEYANLVELRLIMEHQGINTLLLQHHDDLDLRGETVARLKEEISVMGKALKLNDDSMRLHADYRFHGIIIRLCNNVAFNTLYETLHSFIIGEMHEYQSTNPQKKSIRQRHMKLVDAIEEGDLFKALTAFREHIVNINEYLHKPDPELEYSSLEGV